MGRYDGRGTPPGRARAGAGLSLVMLVIAATVLFVALHQAGDQQITTTSFLGLGTLFGGWLVIAYIYVAVIIGVPAVTAVLTLAGSPHARYGLAAFAFMAGATSAALSAVIFRASNRSFDAFGRTYSYHSDSGNTHATFWALWALACFLCAALCVQPGQDTVVPASVAAPPTARPAIVIPQGWSPGGTPSAAPTPEPSQPPEDSSDH